MAPSRRIIKMYGLRFMDWIFEMKPKDIVLQNQDYFIRYPKRAGWLTRLTPHAKGGYWDIEYGNRALMLIEMVRHEHLPKYVASDRVVMITDDEFTDTKDLQCKGEERYDLFI